MKVIKSKSFANGNVYALELTDGMLIETTETFLPGYTKDCVNEHSNKLKKDELGSRNERWMIGVSCMSGCPCRCRFCATGNMPKWRNLDWIEIVEQVELMLKRNSEYSPLDSQEFKINYTRMGEPFLNIENVKKAIEVIDSKYPNTHHYISTIGIKGSDFSWVKDNITLQISLHSCIEETRNNLIPFSRTMTIEEMGKIRTDSKLKTTINMTLVDESDFNMSVIKDNFSKDKFFVKLSPINPNEFSDSNNLGKGAVQSVNLV